MTSKAVMKKSNNQENIEDFSFGSTQSDSLDIRENIQIKQFLSSYDCKEEETWIGAIDTNVLSDSEHNVAGPWDTINMQESNIFADEVQCDEESQIILDGFEIAEW
jgi:hypothetical protein